MDGTTRTVVSLHRLQEPLFGFAIFLLCAIGIISRPMEGLATIWPANAFMLGLMLRFPALAGLRGWLWCAAGYVGADLLMGTSAFEILAWNSCNLISVFVGYRLLRKNLGDGNDSAQPTAFMHFLRAIVAASLVSGLMSGAVVSLAPSNLYFTGEKMGYWAASELLNYIALLPVFLHFPGRARLKELAVVARGSSRVMRLLPAAALAVSALPSIWLGGPVAVAVPVPALLWCAVVYDRFWVSCLSFMFIVWTLLAIRNGWLNVGGDLTAPIDVISIRLGVALVALAPLFVSAALAMRNDMAARLRLVAERDSLTGLLNRRLFMERGSALHAQSLQNGRLAAVLVIDLDRFEALNKQYGRSAGEQVLVAVGGILKARVSGTLVAGRLGSEEFAAVMQGLNEMEIGALAKAIVDELGSRHFPDLAEMRPTVSIGIGVAKPSAEGGAATSFSGLLAMADHALYRVKAQGRNGYGFAAEGDRAYLAQGIRR